MRTSVLPSMLEILTRNYNFRNKSARLYELGRIYLARPDGMADEPKILSLGAYGSEMDFFTLKGDIQAILRRFRVQNVSFRPVIDNPSYHPGRCAQVLAGGSRWASLDRSTLGGSNYGVDAPLYCAELSFDDLFAARGTNRPEYKPLPKFPAVTRDVAVVCDEAVTVGALEACIRKGAKGLLKDAALFDIYRGKGVAEGEKSVAFNLILRADDRSLTAEEARPRRREHSADSGAGAERRPCARVPTGCCQDEGFINFPVSPLQMAFFRVQFKHETDGRCAHIDELDFTRKFNIRYEKDQEINTILTSVYDSLKQKGYDPINQIVGCVLLSKESPLISPTITMPAPSSASWIGTSCSRNSSNSISPSKKADTLNGALLRGRAIFETQVTHGRYQTGNIWPPSPCCWTTSGPFSAQRLSPLSGAASGRPAGLPGLCLVPGRGLPQKR